jgi:uncharacterized protein YjbJ (UPF0337 family)
MLITGADKLLTARSVYTELAAATARSRRAEEWFRATLQGGRMDWDRIKGKWKQMGGQAKQQWGKLTDDDLTRIDGKRDELEGLLQERYGKSKDDVRKEVDDWLTRV